MLITSAYAGRHVLNLSDEGARHALARAGLARYVVRTATGVVFLYDEDEVMALAQLRAIRPPKMGRPRKHEETGP
jgi:hypothetical protein